MKKAKKVYLTIIIICAIALPFLISLWFSYNTLFGIATIIDIILIVIGRKQYNKIKNYEDYSKYTKSTPITNIKGIMGKKYNITPLSEEKESIYKPKKLLSKSEINFGNAIYKALPNGYKLYPQICLRSIIEKTDNSRYGNELFRIIDFAIFDKNYLPVLLIEINDDSHHDYNRYRRDNKVKDICEQANIPLIRLWTEQGINPDYINKKIRELLKTNQE